jgi:hypothetical protein
VVERSASSTCRRCSRKSFFDVFLEIPEPSCRRSRRTSSPGRTTRRIAVPAGYELVGQRRHPVERLGCHWQNNYHFTQLLVRPGSGSSHIHALIFCGAATGATWSITGLCPGWTATLLNENFTPAPNPVAAGMDGLDQRGRRAGVPSGSHCCFSVNFICDGEPATIDVCAEACLVEYHGRRGRRSTAGRSAST